MLLVLLPGCDGASPPPGPGDSGAPTSSEVAPTTPEEAVSRLPGGLGGTVVKLNGVPTEFPTSLAGIPDVRFGPQSTGVMLTYRPYEAPDDTGWSSESLALLQRNGGWARLSLGSLGMQPDLWPGNDPLGSGVIDDAGRQLAFRASSGVVVIDLESGGVRHYLGDVGLVGGIRWHPGGTRLTADPVEPGPDVVVAVRSGSVSEATVALRGLGFLADGEAVSVTRRGEHDVVESHNADDRTSVDARLVASPLMTGRRFQSWFSGSRVAYSNIETVRGRYALRVADLDTEQAVAALTWSRRTGTFLTVHGWWDRQRLLISLDGSLVTWAPDSGSVIRVAALPPSDFRLAHGAVGLSFPQTVG